jgi:hypothetical protein
MTQAEKAELRYYAIMTQVTQSHQDMARTLETPANQIRVLKAQITQAARALGNIFIPILNKVLPYAIAVAKVIRHLADVIAGLMNFTLPEMDYSNVDNMSSSLGDANKEAKKLKNHLLGIDELNVLSENDSGEDGSGSGFDFELPTYEFIDKGVESKVGEIVKKMKEWLGITEDIDSWADLFNTNLGEILEDVGLIGIGIAAWKVSQGTLDAISTLKNLLKSPSHAIAIGATLTLTGFQIEFNGLESAVENGLGGINFARIVSGGLIGTGGAAILGSGLAAWIGKAFTGSAIDLAITQAGINIGAGTVAAAGAAIAAAVGAIVAGIPAFFVGIYDACANGIDWLSALLVSAGATAGGAGIGAVVGMLGGPIGAGIGALIGLAVGLVTDGIILIVQNWDTIATSLSNFFTVTIPNIWNKFVTALTNFFTVTIPGAWDKFVSWLANLPSAISKWFDDLLQPIVDFDWYAFGYSIGMKAGMVVKTVCESVKKFFTETLPNVWETVKNAFVTFFTKTLPDFITKDIPAFWRTIVTTLKNFFTQTIPSLWTTIKNEFIKFFTKTLPKTLSNVGDWFKDIGKAIWGGIKKGWDSAITGIGDMADGLVDGFKKALGIHSPSRVFYGLAGYTVEGFNLGFKSTSKSTKGIVNDWAKGISSISPTMAFAVDTSALKYYNSNSFARSVSANVNSNTSVTAVGFMEGMEEFYREYVAPTITQMASDVRRQADKNEQTVVRIGNRTVNDAVTTQRRANGYAFAR